MEALSLEKPLVVVVNAALMDDHQQELAHAMEEQVCVVWEGGCNDPGCWIDPHRRIDKARTHTQPHRTLTTKPHKGFLVATDPAGLVPTLRARRYEGLTIRPPPTPGLLPALLDEEMGFTAGGGGAPQQGEGAAEGAGAARAGGASRARRRR